MGYGRGAFTCLFSSTSTQRHARNWCIAKKLILTIRAIMIGQHIDLVAGDFNGTAWRCSNRDNLSTMDEAFADCALPAPPGPAPLWGPGSNPNNIGRYECMALSLSHAKLSACVQPIKAATNEKKVTGVQEEGDVFLALASETDRLQNESQ